MSIIWIASNLVQHCFSCYSLLFQCMSSFYFQYYPYPWLSLIDLLVFQFYVQHFSIHPWEIKSFEYLVGIPKSGTVLPIFLFSTRLTIPCTFNLATSSELVKNFQWFVCVYIFNFESWNILPTIIVDWLYHLRIFR